MLVSLRTATRWLLGLLYLASVALPVMAQPYAGRMGVEAPGDVFVDLVRQSYRWDKPNGAGDWTALTAADVDANGWPKTDVRWIYDGRPVAEWTGSIDDPDAYRVNYAGTYKGSFTGQAVLTRIEGPFTISNQVYNAGTNQTTFDLTIGAPGPGHGLVIFSFTQTKRTATSPTGSGISDFRLVRPGYGTSPSQVFTNAFISTLTSARFSTIRFMGVTNTNGNVEYSATGTLLQSWNNRKKTTDAAQTGIPTLNKKDGWAWEYVIQVCNQANMDLWLNIPVAVDDNYITQLATLVKNTLNPNLNVYLEHSNEMWNFGFTQYAWNKNRAVEEVNAGGSNYRYDGSADQEIWAQRRHAKRVRDIVTIFGGVFGSGSVNARVRGVLAGVTPDPNGFFIVGRLPGMLQYLKDNYGDPKNYIYAISVPLYYGGDAASGRAGTENFTVQQIIDAMRTSSDAEVNNRRNVVTLAQTYGLPGGFSSYEGGPDIGGGSTTNIGNRIRAVRDPQQKDVYKRNFAQNFWDIGGRLAMQFTLASSYNRFGAWGLTDDINNPDRNALFQAVRELIGPTSTPLRDPENPAGAVNGLDYAYYEGAWSALPDFGALTPVKRGTVTNFDLSVRNRNDDFGLRYTGFVNVPTDGTYTFYTASDDGSKLFIGTTQVVDNDGLHGIQERSGTIGLKAGRHALTVPFFERTGGEGLTVSYAGPGIGKQAIPASALFRVPSGGTGTGLRAEYFNNMTLTAPAVLTRTDATVNFDWGTSSPAPGTVNAENFSVRWTGQVEAPASGNYTFSTISDDGVRLWVNNNLVIDNWTNHAPTTDNSAPIALTGGQRYSIRMEFFDNTVGAVAKLLWTYPGQAQQAIPQGRLYPATGGRVAAYNSETPADADLIYPNPAQSAVTIRYRATTNGPVSIVLLTGTSRALLRTTANVVAGENAIRVELPDTAPSGHYVLRVSDEAAQSQAYKLLISR